MPGYFDNPVWNADTSNVSFNDWSPNSANTWDAGTSPESFMSWGQGPNSRVGNIPGVPGVEPSAWEKFTGSKQVGPGWGKLGLGALQGVGNFALGLEQLGLAKDHLRIGKQQFAKQFDFQKKDINRRIMDTGRRRYARNPAGNPTPDEYYEANKFI